ncbi:MAG: hypothetical protein HQL70_01685 [Magnetococcales bacterium]|nr:hypothetical protein [Magnetococcales bacterium]
MAKKLVLRASAKIQDLFGEFNPGCEKFEASGVVKRNDDILVVFDSCLQIAQLTIDGPSTKPVFNGRAWIIPTLTNVEDVKGFEGITRNRMLGDDKLYMVAESLERSDEKGKKFYNGKVVTLDQSYSGAGEWLDYRLPSSNKGFEGVAVITSPGKKKPRLFALCEGNRCRAGEAGKKPGKGRIRVFKPGDGKWIHLGKMSLPEQVKFIDYSDLDIVINTKGTEAVVAVLSQASRQLWVGKLGMPSFKWQGQGKIYNFPSKSKGSFCTVEGVSWLDDKCNKIIVVSDKRKSDHPEGCKNYEQSIHLFELP